MRADTPVYPSLGRYFKTMTELGDAACMSRDKATRIVQGKAEFTAREKQAIKNAIIARLYQEGKTEQAKTIVKGDFDKLFKRRSYL